MSETQSYNSDRRGDRAVVVLNRRVAEHLSGACARRVAMLAAIEAGENGMGMTTEEASELSDLIDVIGVLAGAVLV